MRTFVYTLVIIPFLCLSSYGAVFIYDVGLTLASGSGSGSGTITIDDSVAGSSPNFFFTAPATAGWTDMSLTFTGTTGGTSDGTFTLADLTGVMFNAGGATVDYSSDLVPQFTDINLDGGEFFGVASFTFDTSSGDTFQITSMTVVPEPSMFAYLLMFAGLVATRRRRVNRQ